MDTWHILEQRFHGIGNRDHNVVMEFHEKNNEEHWYQLAGPRPEGEWIGVLIGRSEDGSVPKQDFSTGHYSVTELGETLRRAGKLLNIYEKRDSPDPIGMRGSRRFVALLVKNFGQLAHEVVVTGHTIRFFANAARACGMMAGKLATQVAAKPDFDPLVETLPFGLQRCDVPQTLKRPGHNPVTIQNAEYWKLMEKLMAACPNAVSEETLQHLFPPNYDRENYERENSPKKLRDIIDSLGLTVKKWVLMEL